MRGGITMMKMEFGKNALSKMKLYFTYAHPVSTDSSASNDIV